MNGLRWSADDMPECLRGYDGQFALTLWYKAVSRIFRTNCPIGRHFRSFKFHQNCFVASEAVTWLQEQLKTDRFKVDFTRDQTLALIQTMQRLEKMFVDVRGKACDTEKIQDNGALYRFCDYEAFGDWGLPCQTLNSDQICAVEIVNGINCNALYSHVKKVKAEKTNYVVQEQQKELYHSLESGQRELASTLAPHHALDEEILTRELFSSPAFGRINFASRTSGQGVCIDGQKAPRGSAPRLSAHEAALEEKWTSGSTDLPGFDRRNSVSRLNNQFSKTGKVKAHLNRVQSLASKSRKQFIENRGLRERSNERYNEPLARTDSARRNPARHHETIWSEFHSFDTKFGVHTQLSQNHPAEANFLANDLLKMKQMQAFKTSTLRNDLDAHKAPLFEPVSEPEMDFEPLIRSNSYLSQAKSLSELQLLLDFTQRLRNLLSVKDLNSVFDTSVINLTDLLDNLYETGGLVWDEELFPRYVLEVLQSLVNWPTGEGSFGSRCLTHAFDFMENYFTCVIDPLFTYKLYPVFAGVIETLRRNKRCKTGDSDKENLLSQKNQFCICLQDKVYGQCVIESHGSDDGLSSHRNPKYSAPVSTSTESFVSRKATCMPCSILSDNFGAQDSKLKKKVQDGITLPRNHALESYLRRNTTAEVDTCNTSLHLSVLSAESNELYETALSSFSEFGVDSSEEQSIGFVDNSSQHDIPVGFNVNDCKILQSGNLQQTNSESSFDHTYYNSLVSDISEAKLVEVLQLCCLLLNSLERRRIRLFLDVIRKIVWNVNVTIKGGNCKCEQMACRFATTLFQCKDARQYDPQLASSLTAFFIRYGEFILERPKQCEIAPSGQCQCARCHSMPSNSSERGSTSGEVPVTYCNRITRDEYELQSSGGTKSELRKLLEDIISNKTLSAKTKNNQLKKFEKAYPDIYHERFPVTAIPRTRPPSFRKPLNMLRNLRI